METPRIRHNIIANYVGAGWNALMSFVFVPWYLKYLGIEAYGVIGFFASIQAVLSLLDMGLGATFGREVAALSTKPDSATILRSLTKTFATVYWGIAIVAGILFAILAPVFAHYWLKAEALSANTIIYSTLMMGLIIIARWPGNIYAGGLTGLQRQVDTNVIGIVAATLRGFGAIGVLKFISPTLYAFFGWQLVITLFNTASFRFMLYRRLPASNEPVHFMFSLIKDRWRFAAGMMGISLVTLVLTQLDKLLLSKMVSLREFGYYALASTLGGVVYMIITPITGAFYPRFTALVGQGNQNGLTMAFHDASQLIAFCLVPGAVTVAMFSKEILLLWTRNAEIAEHAHWVLTLVVVGSLCNAFMNIPYYIQLAHGWTKFAFWYNLVAIVFLVPAIFYLTRHYGIIGGASAWTMLNASYVLIGAHIIFRKHMIGEKGRWYLWSVIAPLFVMFFVGRCLKLQSWGGDSSLCMAFKAALSAFIGYIALLFLLPVTRKNVLRKLFG